MRIAEVKVFKYDELSDRSKEKARDWYRECSRGDEWWDFTFEDCDLVAKLLGIQIDNIMFSGFSSQGDGACFTGTYSYAEGSCEAIRAFAPQDEWLHRIVDGLYEAQKECGYKAECKVTHRGHYNHSGCTGFDFEELPSGDPEAEVKRCLRSFMDWIYRKLETEYDWRDAGEQVEENIQANEYEFEEDGSFYP